MNVSRRCMDGSVHPEESLNKSQIYVNFFGQKSYKDYIYSYSKLTQEQKNELASALRN